MVGQISCLTCPGGALSKGIYPINTHYCTKGVDYQGYNSNGSTIFLLNKFVDSENLNVPSELRETI